MRRRLGRQASAYRRTVVVALVSALVVGIGLSPAIGQEDGDDGGPAATEGPGNGTAKATAVVARVAPGVGSLELGISSGVAVAEIKNTIAQAQAEALDLGLIGGVVTAESCTGGDAVVPASALPTALRVDSRGGDVEAEEEELPVDGATIGGGRKAVEATTDPAARAVSTVLGALGPVLSFDGGKAESTTRVLPGEGREARASVGVNLDIAGLVKLTGLHWEAYHRSGTDPAADASFDLGTAALLGTPIPIESLAQVEEVVNDLLAPSGLSISFPKIERFTEPADLVRITPLRIVLKDSPAGAELLGPVLELSRQQREQLFDAIAAAYCTAAGALLVGDIGLAIASGTGFLAIEIGGAEATSGDLVVENPFGETSAPVATDQLLPTPPIPGVSAPLPVPAVRDDTGLRPAASVGPLEERCESAHPLRQTACSHGALLAVGLAGLVATVGVGTLDWRRQRRRGAPAPSGEAPA